MAKDKGTNKEKDSFFQGVKSEMENELANKRRTFKYTVIVVSTVIFFMVFFLGIRYRYWEFD